MRYKYARQTYVFGTGWIPAKWLEEEARMVPVPDLLDEEEENIHRDLDESEEETETAQPGDSGWCESYLRGYGLGAHTYTRWLRRQVISL